MPEGGDTRRMRGIAATGGPACDGGCDGGCGGSDVGGEEGHGGGCTDDEGVAAPAKRASPSHRRRVHLVWVGLGLGVGVGLGVGFGLGFGLGLGLGFG